MGVIRLLSGGQAEPSSVAPQQHYLSVSACSRPRLGFSHLQISGKIRRVNMETVFRWEEETKRNRGGAIRDVLITSTWSDIQIVSGKGGV